MLQKCGARGPLLVLLVPPLRSTSIHHHSSVPAPLALAFYLEDAMPRDPRFTPVPDPDASLLQEVRALFEAGALTRQQAAERLGLTLATFTSRLRKRWFWTLPERLRSQRAKAPLRHLRKGAAQRVEKMTVRKRKQLIDEQIEVVLRAIEANADAGGQPLDAEKHGRLIAMAIKLQMDSLRANASHTSRKKESAADGSHDIAQGSLEAAHELARLRADLADKLAGDDAARTVDADIEQLRSP